MDFPSSILGVIVHSCPLHPFVTTQYSDYILSTLRTLSGPFVKEVFGGWTPPLFLSFLLPFGSFRFVFGPFPFLICFLSSFLGGQESPFSSPFCWIVLISPLQILSLPWPLLIIIYRAILVYCPSVFVQGGGDPARIHQGVNRPSRLLAGQTALRFSLVYCIYRGDATFSYIPQDSLQPVTSDGCDQATFPCIVKPRATIGSFDRSDFVIITEGYLPPWNLKVLCLS